MVNKLVLLAVSLLCITVFLLIARFPELYFLNDDNIFIPASKNLNFLYGTSFRPVSDITLFTDYSLWGAHAGGYHYSNFFFHLVTTILIYFLSVKLFRTYDAVKDGGIKALAVAVLFFFYPFHSESVFWIIGRGGLLGALFGVASLLLYLHREKSNWLLAASILVFLIGAFAYETIWIVPLLIIVITWLDIQKSVVQKNKRCAEAIVFCSFFVLYLIARRSIIGEIGGSPYGSSAIMQFNIISLARNYAIMFARSFLPPLQSTYLLVGLFCVIILLAFLFLRKFGLHKILGGSMTFSLGGFLISFLPVVTLGVDSHDSESERFLYFPSVFAVLLMTEVIFEIAKTGFQRSLLFAVLCSTEIFYLAGAAKVYQTSSQVARTSIMAIQTITVTGKVFCINLPTQYNGGLIYKNGFEAATAWLAPNNKSTFITVSQKEMMKPSQPYRIQNLALKAMSHPDSLHLLQELSPQQTFSANDVILKWTDAGLLIIK